MKKYVLLGFLLISTTVAWACSCVPPTTFCDIVTRTIKFDSSNLIVFKVRIAEATDEVARFEVLDVYAGKESRASIRVFRGGLLCPDAGFGAVGETFIYFLSRIDAIMGNNPLGMKVGDYRLPLCTLIKLKVEGGQIIGPVTEQRTQVVPEGSFICEGLNNSDFFLSNVKIAPNPVVNQLIFKGLERGVTVRVFDITGRLTLERFVSKDNPTLALGHLASGMYIVRIQRLNEVFVAKIVKI